jgi:DNA-binding NarL/FixJ family response regulator
MKRRTRVLLADDHPIVIEGLATLLKGHFELVGTVGNGNELIEAARKLRPDVIVLELSTRTVESHKYEMMRALKVESTAELVRYAVQIGLVAR